MLEVLLFKKGVPVSPPITFLGANSKSLPASQAAMMTMPGSRVDGDIALLFITSINGRPTVQGGWTFVGGSSNLYFFSKKLITTDTTVSITSDSFVRAATILAYRGAAGVSSSAVSYGGPTYILTSLQVNDTNSVFINAVADTQPKAPTKDPLQTTRGNTITTTYHALVVSDEVMKTIGPSGTRTMTNGSASSGGSGISVLIR